MKTLMRSLHLATVAALLSACATPPPATVTHPAPPPPPPPVATVPPAPVAPPPAAPTVDTGASERALVAAIGAYDRGEFAAAIRQLNPMISDGSLDPAQLLRALKVLAFSQCSSGATTA